jgi:hypothetical protein
MHIGKGNIVKLTKAQRALVQRARGRIANGWTKGTLHRRSTRKGVVTDRYCLVGALYADPSWKRLSAEGRYRVREAVNDAIQRRTGSIMSNISFNDRPSTKKKDVLAVLDDVLAKEA